MFRMTKRTTGAAAGLLLTGLVLSACAAEAAPSASVDSPDAIGDGGTIRLLVNPSGTQSFPPFVMDTMDLDEKYGFNLEIVNSTDAATVFRAGDADAMVTSWNVVGNLNNAGVGIIGVAPFTSWVNTVVVPEDGDVETVGDLEGKRVGIFGRTSADWFILDAYAQQEYGVDLEVDATLTEGQSPALLRGLIEQGQLDATQMYNDLTPAMTGSGDFRVLETVGDMADAIGLPEEVPVLLYGFSIEFTEENPDNVRAFVKAYQEAIAILMEDDEVWAAQAANLEITDEGVIAELREMSRSALRSSFTEDSESQLQEMADILIPLVGETNLGFSKMPDKVITLEFQ
ncbi:MAG TPA: ABC transporter substrate-binding protein [Pseudolysinimonas sp.]|nr:ABC transporter substrate-binding protein [Pseudolysinimonas sp.]